VIRWLRQIATATIILSMIGLGVLAGLFLVANAGWIPVNIHPWLAGMFGDKQHEVWLPGLFAGWLVSAILLTALVLWSMFYVWRWSPASSASSRSCATCRSSSRRRSRTCPRPRARLRRAS
jgi:H+/Cl- antiporter ClcA